jgi:hypothetical protein
LFHRDFFLHPAGKALRKARGKPGEIKEDQLQAESRNPFCLLRTLAYNLALIFPKGEEK